MKRSNLDERQEQELLKIEHNGCWFAFWGLLVALIVQTVAPEGVFPVVGGEWLIFMILCCYMSIACIRKGIWDRKYRADLRTNLMFSLVCGLIVMLFVGAVAYVRAPGAIFAIVFCGLIAGAFSFLACLVLLSIFARSYRKRVDELNAEPEEEEK